MRSSRRGPDPRSRRNRAGSPYLSGDPATFRRAGAWAREHPGL